jgi:hypothetical protein
MFIANAPSDQDAIRKYYNTGYYSLEEFMQYAHSLQLKTHEAKPELAYNGHKPLVSSDRRHDDRRAKTALLHQGCEIASRGTEEVIYLEFGVRAGVSISAAAQKLPKDSKLYGFDTFTGLPDGWVCSGGLSGRINRVREAGEMAVENFPDISDRRIILIKGLIQDTLPSIIPMVSEKRLFINIDTDTYTAALYVLAMLHPYIKNGDVVYFDEFVDSLNEYAAFNDYIRSFYMKDRFIPVGRAFDAFLFEIASS